VAVIVRHRESGERYVLIGTGFGAYHATKPNWFFGNLVADQKSGEISVVAVCNGEGSIGWFMSSDLSVDSVDGVAPSVVLGTG
jgi:hypothetical protein